MIFIAASAILGQAASGDPLPRVESGTIVRIPDIASRYVSSRHVDVWIPEGLAKGTKCRVIYMHDGQMLFDPANTWNHKAWMVERTLAKLIKEKKVPPTIVVGVWNSPTRRADYLPEKPLAYVSEPNRSKWIETTMDGKPQADAYLKFLVTELKPVIDRTFPVLSGPESTSIAGSSMGGLISMYAVCEYPDIFGSAGCLSTHWPGLPEGTAANEVPEAFLRYLDAHVPLPKGHRFYFDHGDKTLDAHYAPWQKKADAIMRAHGYTSRDFMTLAFPGQAHDEDAWSGRLAQPLQFLLGS